MSYRRDNDYRQPIKQRSSYADTYLSNLEKQETPIFQNPLVSNNLNPSYPSPRYQEAYSPSAQKQSLGSDLDDLVFQQLSKMKGETIHRNPSNSDIREMMTAFGPLIDMIKPIMGELGPQLNQINQNNAPPNQELNEQTNLILQTLNEINKSIEKINSRLDKIEKNQEILLRKTFQAPEEDDVPKKTIEFPQTSFYGNLLNSKSNGSSPVRNDNQSIDCVSIVMDDALFMKEDLMLAFQDILKLPVRQHRIQDCPPSDAVILVLYYSGIQNPYQYQICRAIQTLELQSTRVPLKILRIGDTKCNKGIRQLNLREEYNSIRRYKFDVIEHFGLTIENYENNNQICFTEISATFLKKNINL